MITPERKTRLAKVHVAAKELALTEESYRDLLRRVTGFDSAKACSDAQLDQVLAEFKRLGFVGKQSYAGPRSDKAYVRMIYSLWSALRPYVAEHSVAALRAFTRRQVDRESPEFCSPEEANDVIEGLKAWLERERNKASPKRLGNETPKVRRRRRRG